MIQLLLNWTLKNCDALQHLDLHEWDIDNSTVTAALNPVHFSMLILSWTAIVRILFRLAMSTWLSASIDFNRVGTRNSPRPRNNFANLTDYKRGLLRLSLRLRKRTNVSISADYGWREKIIWIGFEAMGADESNFTSSRSSPVRKPLWFPLLRYGDDVRYL